MSLDVPQMTSDQAADQWPAFENAQAWFGPDMARRQDEWILHWTEAELAEIEAAVQSVQKQGLEILDIDAGHFPLPTLTRRLAQIKSEVLHGRGFVLLRGLPVERWSTREAAIAYWGLGTHLGEPCSQNGKGHVLGHVKNLGLNYSDALTRGYQTNARLPYHTDSSDIVGLLCLKTSKTGGRSSIVSSTTVYNEMRRRRPDLMSTLTKPFCRTRWGEVPEGKNPWAEIPPFMPHQGRLIMSYVRSAINKAQAMEGIPKLTALQKEALDTLDALTEDPALHLDMDFKPGDIQLLCNHSVLHSRTTYEDWPEPEKRRHLLRLWLACADGPALPAAMTVTYQGQTENGRPNGIRTPGVPLIAPLDAQ